MTAPVIVLVAFFILLIAGGTYVNIMDNREERAAEERQRQKLLHNPPRYSGFDDNIRLRLSITNLNGQQWTVEQHVSQVSLYQAHDPLTPIMYALDDVTYKMRQTIAEQLR